jgi:alpha-glucosidase
MARIPLRRRFDDRIGAVGRRLRAALEALMQVVRSGREGVHGPSRRTLLGGALAGAAGVAATAVLPAGAARADESGTGRSVFPDEAVIAASPNRRISIGVWVERGAIRWAVTQDGEVAVAPSSAGLLLSDGTLLGTSVRVVGTFRRKSRGSWTPTYGRNAVVPDEYDEVRASFAAGGGRLGFDVVVRAYDYGTALRYELTDAPNATVSLAGELTQFVLPDGAVVFGSRDEDPFLATPPDAIPVSGGSSSDSGALFDNPVTAVLPGGGLACICESDRAHYPRMMLSGRSGSALGVHLMQFAGRSGSPPAVTSFDLATPATTPWRVLVLGASGPELLDHAELVTTLAAPNQVGDTSWIKPGKALRVTSLTTQAGLDGVDFAVARGLGYIEFDAGWYGPEGSSSSDPTKPIAALDLPTVISYANSKGVGVLLYVNRIALGDPDALFGLYQRWGVAGLKLGFILDGTQAQTDQVTGFARIAAKYQLLLNQHDDLRPFGQERTFPNWITLEGVRGNEHFPTATHNVTLPFTRNIPGPMDYTVCVAQSRDQTTDAHQIARAAVYYQPLEWLYWYDQPSKYASGNWPELPWLDAVPTVWDESRALAGAIGQYIAIARRSGDRWYLGAMTNEQGRVLEIPLDFLGDGTWTATIYADGAPNDAPHGTPIIVSTRTVTAADTLSMLLAPSGGQAATFHRP